MLGGGSPSVPSGGSSEASGGILVMDVPGSCASDTVVCCAASLAIEEAKATSSDTPSLAVGSLDGGVCSGS